jgi:cytosine/adenosine deaminase-related metal-dependent hydrolase
MPEPRILIEARNRAVAVEGGVIVEAEGPFDLVLRFPEGEVRPGLINAHDHLHRNHYGRLGSPPYADAYGWADDIQSRHGDAIATGRALARRRALLIGAWKNLFAGVTTVVHHDRWEPDFESDFPIRVARLPSEDSLGRSPALKSVPAIGPFALHVAEGTSARAADEVRKLQTCGLLGPRLMAVHGVGMDHAGVNLFRASGAALVWCPSSNLFLFGRTAPAELLEKGVDVLLGSDSLLTGAGDLLDELRLAASLALIDDERLRDAVGATAARRLQIPQPSLDPGARADLNVLAAPLLEASADDVALVIVDGVLRVAHPRLAAQLAVAGKRARIATVGGVTRWIDPEPRAAETEGPPWMNLTSPPEALPLRAS